MPILDEIVAQRVRDVADAKERIPEAALNDRIKERESKHGRALDVLERLHAPAPSGWCSMALAAEFKRASPSKGDIAVDMDIEDQAFEYASGGASMISVLTEPKWFKGSLEDMETVCSTVLTRPQRPAVLRKDFIIDEYQLLEARAYGADCVLLIVAILTPSLLKTLMKATLSLGMTPLVEVNNEAELAIALDANARLIGVNNRDLRTFKLDLDTTGRIANEIQARGLSLGRNGITLMALSGIHSHADVVKFESCGARGILVGESLMKSKDTKTMINQLMTSSESVGSVNTSIPLVKICGITTVEDAMVALRNGANLIGIILVENSPRYVDMKQAQAIVEAVRSYGERTDRILEKYLNAQVASHSKTTAEWFQRNAVGLREACHRAPLVVGVVANQSIEKMNEIAQTTGVDILQLHGDEGFAICDQVEIPTIRVFHLPDYVSSNSVDAEAIVQHVEPNHAEFLLLDTTVKGQQGGTGTTFDWRIAAVLNQTACLPCLMAGGLTPENVSKAMTIASPLGVDVSSGVEKQKGMKDHDKVRAFLHVTQTSFNHLTIQEEENDN